MGCRVLQKNDKKITFVYKGASHKGIDIVGPCSTLDYIVAHSDGTVVAVVSNINYNTSKTGQRIYGNYVKEYDDVVSISRMFLSDYFKGINSFDYLEEINTINVDYLNQVLKDVFNEKNMILSVVKS